jgi:hypothetical protein
MENDGMVQVVAAPFPLAPWSTRAEPLTRIRVIYRAEKKDVTVYVVRVSAHRR